MTEEKPGTCTISTVDFKEKTVRETFTADHDKGIPQLLRSMAVYAAENNVESIVIATIENGNVCNEVLFIKDEPQKTLMALYLEDIRTLMKQEIFNEADEETS